jgi:hypothetical protein
MLRDTEALPNQMAYSSGVGVCRADEQISMVEALQVSDGILVTSAGILYAAIAPKTPLTVLISHSWISIARQFCIQLDRISREIVTVCRERKSAGN